ncbi:MAG: hypothetical protein IPP93_16180 [Chitinophagaceae bacterium]|nr:hypothetical protein [Chitinophagaceae bacterium]
MQPNPQHIVYQPNNNYGLIGGTSSTIGSGYPNTQAIVTGSNNDPGTAAAYCNNLVLNGYDDWFLPSLEEIRYFADHMTFHQWLTYIMDLYWSSSESSPNQAYFAVIGGGASFNTYDKKIDHAVLPMRRF